MFTLEYHIIQKSTKLQSLPLESELCISEWEESSSAAIALISVAVILAAGSAAFFGSYSAQRISADRSMSTTTVTDLLISISTETLLKISTATMNFTTTDSSPQSLYESSSLAVQLTSATLSSGAATTTGAEGANFQLSFNNPGSSTNISSIVLSSGGQDVSIQGYFICVSTTSCTQIANFSDAFVIPNGPGTQVIVYFGTPLTSGYTYNYVINFTNRQVIAGSMIAQ